MVLVLQRYMLPSAYLYVGGVDVGSVTRTLHSPMCPDRICRNLSDSAGFCRTQLPDYVSVTRAKLAYLVQEESSGAQWSLPEYGIIRWSLWIPTILFRWIPMD